MLVILNVAV
uniref:Uncharacterized protein n=1 Tax=Anguilla anguilla TaxID=7936 RepID=A0A0E9Q6P1_ANGAN